jgi:hypothetical protein
VPYQAGTAVSKILELKTAKEPGLTATHREGLARFGHTMARQYDEIALDGSDDRLPESKGITKYLAWPIRVRPTADTVLVSRRSTENEAVSKKPGPELVAELRKLAPDPWRPGEDPTSQVVIHADRDEHWDRVVAILRSAREAGFVVAALAVRDGRALRQSVLELGPYVPQGTDGDISLAVLEITEGGYELKCPRVTDPKDLLPCAQRWRKLFPTSGALRVTASATTTVQRVVTALQVAANCEVDVGAEFVPEACVLWRAYVHADTEPLR